MGLRLLSIIMVKCISVKCIDNYVVTYMVWSVSGKVLNVRRIAGSTKPDLLFKYDALGQRITKIVIPRTAAGPKPQQDWKYTIYVRDAQGNVMATYSRFFETCGTIDWRDKLLKPSPKLATFKIRENLF